MKKIALFTILCFALSRAQSPDSLSDSLSIPSEAAEAGISEKDSLNLQSADLDSIMPAAGIDSSALTVATDSLSNARDEIHKEEKHEGMRLTKRTFDHKRQVVLGVGMMAFIAIILTTTQSLNPD